MANTDQFEFSLQDRLRNVSLAPSQYNSMIPVIEAISNSIHSIEDRFSKALSKGQVEVRAIYDEEGEYIEGFSITDNGMGFTDENYKSFKRADSPFKEKRGGKGVGRLTWLKAFSKVSVSSDYRAGTKNMKRVFSFSAVGEMPIFDLEVSGSGAKKLRTTVTLHPYKEVYRNRLFKKESSIVREIVRHFIGYLIGDNHIQISFVGRDETIQDLHFEFLKEIIDERNDVVELSDTLLPDRTIRIRHFLVGKNFRDQEAKGYNHIYMCGDRRPVKHHSIDSAIGLTAIRGEYVYVSLIEGDVLDSSVNQERTNFSADDDVLEEIRRVGIDLAKQFLVEDIKGIRTRQETIAEQVVQNNPRYLVIARDISKFVEDDLKLSDAKDEEIELALARRLIRKRKEVIRSIQKVKDSEKVDGAFDEALSSYRDFVTKESAYSLADYVVRRRAVIAAIETSRKYKEGSEKYVYEEAIHNFICPIRSTSDDVDYDQHNLWLLDDRLAFYSYFHSDRKVSKIVLDANASGEPDITFFDLSFGFERPSTQQPIVIVEFKKPSRKDYNSEDPVKQVMRYVRQFREGTIAQDKDGRDLSHIGTDTQFHGIIVADLNKQLLEATEATFVKQKTPDGIGRFGYDADTKTFIEIIPYAKLIKDAKARNEAFFTQLGLS